MTEQHEEHSLEEEQQHIADCAGMIDYKHFTQFKFNASYGLIYFGCAFLKSLGMTLNKASDKDAVKIIKIWSNECSNHEILFRIHLAKEKAEKEAGG